MTVYHFRIFLQFETALIRRRRKSPAKRKLKMVKPVQGRIPSHPE
jgi:hypothetical protein